MVARVVAANDVASVLGFALLLAKGATLGGGCSSLADTGGEATDTSVFPAPVLLFDGAVVATGPPVTFTPPKGALPIPPAGAPPGPPIVLPVVALTAIASTRSFASCCTDADFGVEPTCGDPSLLSLLRRRGFSLRRERMVALARRLNFSGTAVTFFCSSASLCC